MTAWEKDGTQRGPLTTKWRGSLKDGGHKRRSCTGQDELRLEGDGGTENGVRTEDSGWFDLSHVCVQPRLFAASWIPMKRWFPMSPGPFCLSPGRCVLSCTSKFDNDLSFFQVLWTLVLPEAAILKVLLTFSLHVSSLSKLWYRMRSLKALKKKHGVYQPFRFCCGVQHSLIRH